MVSIIVFVVHFEFDRNCCVHEALGAGKKDDEDDDKDDVADVNKKKKVQTTKTNSHGCQKKQKDKV